MPNHLADKQLIEHFRQRIAELELELLEVPEARSRINQLGEVIVTLKEQNALLTVQVQRFKDAQWQQAGWTASWMLRNGMSDNINATAFAELQDHLASLSALTAHPQQAKSEDARDGERYRFMCGQGRYVPDPFGNGWAFGMGQECSKQALDAAIDAAISAQEPKG